MDYLGELAKQGLGYLLFVVSIGVNIHLYREKTRVDKQLAELAEKRVEDIKEMRDMYFDRIDEVKNGFLMAVDKMQGVAMSTLTIAQNIQSILNARK